MLSQAKLAGVVCFEVIQTVLFRAQSALVMPHKVSGIQVVACFAKGKAHLHPPKSLHKIRQILPIHLMLISAQHKILTHGSDGCVTIEMNLEMNNFCDFEETEDNPFNPL